MLPKQAYLPVSWRLSIAMFGLPPDNSGQTADVEETLSTHLGQIIPLQLKDNQFTEYHNYVTRISGTTRGLDLDV